MWALIISGVAHEFVDVDPTGRYNPALQWVVAPPGTVVGDLWDGSAFHKPVEAQQPPRRVLSGSEFLGLFTPASVASLWAADPRLMAGALKVAAQDSANLDSAETAQLLGLAVSKGVLTQAEMDRIIAGTPPPAGP